MKGILQDCSDMTKILDGKETAAALKAELLTRAETLKKGGIHPRLAILLAGDSRPSAMYASFMEKVAKGYGIDVVLEKQPDSISQKELEDLVTSLSLDSSIHGILPMMPLPKGIDADKVISCIDPDKDIDGLTEINAGRLMTGKPGLFGCTPRAVMAILDYYKIDISGKHAVILGRSNVIGKPVALMLLARHATVSICHSRTKDIASQASKADILISCVGRADFVTPDMVKDGAVVIDVGINRKDGKTVGDVSYDEVFPEAGAITPVPGGVGSVTTTMVIENILAAAERK